MTKPIHFLALLLISFSLLFTGCDKDDDDNDSSGGSSPNQTAYLNVTKSGTTYQNGSETFTYQDGSVEYISVYSESPNTSAGLEFLTIPDVGQYSANTERAFAFGIGAEFWFSTSATTITIEVHDQATNYVKGTVAGTMETIGGSSTTNSITAQFAFVY